MNKFCVDHNKLCIDIATIKANTKNIIKSQNDLALKIDKILDSHNFDILRIENKINKKIGITIFTILITCLIALFGYIVNNQEKIKKEISENKKQTEYNSFVLNKKKGIF